MSEPKGRVLKADNGAWFCDCGCRTVYSHSGSALGSGSTEEAAWEDALGHHFIRSKLRKKNRPVAALETDRK